MHYNCPKVYCVGIEGICELPHTCLHQIVWFKYPLQKTMIYIAFLQYPDLGEKTTYQSSQFLGQKGETNLYFLGLMNYVPGSQLKTRQN